MKKILSILLSLAMLTLVIIGCSSNEINPLSDLDGEVSEEENTPDAILPEELESEAELADEPILEISAGRISDEKIYEFMGAGRVKWVVDVNDPKNLMREDAVVVEAKVLSYETAIFVGDDAFLDTEPYTPVNIKVKNVLSGNLDTEIKTVYIMGGNVLIKDFIEFNDKHFPGRIQKMGFDKLIDEEKNGMYISFEGYGGYVFTEGEECVLILEYNPSFGGYLVSFSGYSVFEKSDNTRSDLRSVQERGLTDYLSDFTNVLTGRQFDIE